MSGPYVSSRTGRFSWMMQRVTAGLLIPLAFVHFAMQHFTSDAVSTGLATAFRLHNPFWVAFYVIFVVCVLYHGVNGTIGIVRDYAPKPLPRALIVVVLWVLAVFFGALGIRNLVNPAHNLESAKNWYAINGFPEGESAGNPPNFLWKPRYNFGEELRELNLLNYYLEHHTHRSESAPIASVDIFNGAEYGSDTAAGGHAFDDWTIAIINEGFDAHKANRLRNHIFSTTYEFALWAAHVRKTNAENRITIAEKSLADTENPPDEKTKNELEEVVSDAKATLERLAAVPAYDPSLH